MYCSFDILYKYRIFSSNIYVLRIDQISGIWSIISERR